MNLNLSQIFSFSEGYALLVVAMGAACLGAVSGIIGCFAIIKKQSLLADAISHASLPGIVLAFLITGSRSNNVLLAGAAVIGLIAASQILMLTHRKKIRHDSSLSLMLAVYFGFGMVLLTFMQHDPSSAQAGLETFLFGEAATILLNDVILTAVSAGGIIFILLVFGKEFFLIAFDPEYAAASGLPVFKLDILFTALMVVTIAIGLQTVGVVLMSAMLVAPAAAARQWTHSFRLMVFLAMFFGIVSGITGSVLSSIIPMLPTGPSIIITASGIALVSFLLAPKRGLIPAYLRRKKRQGAADTKLILKTLHMLSCEHSLNPCHSHPLSLLQSLFPMKPALKADLEELKRQGYACEPEPCFWAITDEGIAHINKIESEAGR